MTRNRPKLRQALVLVTSYLIYFLHGVIELFKTCCSFFQSNVTDEI